VDALALITVVLLSMAIGLAAAGAVLLAVLHLMMRSTPVTVSPKRASLA
jgi:hypothetical protein